MNVFRTLLTRIDWKIGTAVLIVLCIIVSFFLFHEPSNHLTVTVISISEQADEYSIEAEYPQFRGVKKQFNKAIEDAVLGQITVFKEDVAKLRDMQQKDDQYILRTSWSPDQLSSKVVSILLRQYVYVGGAHGTHGVESFTYDFEMGKEITLTDIFYGYSGFLDRISQYAMSDIKNQLGSESVMDMIREGTAPSPQNFAVFTLSRDNVITFYFPEYQVAPYASGEQRVSMPLSFITGDSLYETKKDSN